MVLQCGFSYVTHLIKRHQTLLIISIISYPQPRPHDPQQTNFKLLFKFSLQSRLCSVLHSSKLVLLVFTLKAFPKIASSGPLKTPWCWHTLLILQTLEEQLQKPKSQFNIFQLFSIYQYISMSINSDAGLEMLITIHIDHIHTLFSHRLHTHHTYAHPLHLHKCTVFLILFFIRVCITFFLY